METNCFRWAFTRLGVILCASDPRRDYQEPATPAVVRRGNNIDEFDPLELDVIHNIMSKRYSERSPAARILPNKRRDSGWKAWQRGCEHQFCAVLG
jgi:hypothetical protein